MLSSKKGGQGRGEAVWVSLHISAGGHWVQGCQQSQGNGDPRASGTSLPQGLRSNVDGGQKMTPRP